LLRQEPVPREGGRPMSDYTPSDHEIRARAVAGAIRTIRMADEKAEAQYDRWIAAHNESVRAAERERIAQDILAEADRIDPSDDWPEDGFTTAFAADGLRKAARIVRRGA